MSGAIAFAGDRDLLTFSVAAPGAIARFGATQSAVAGSPLKLRARLLKLSAATPSDLATATSLIDVASTAAGAGARADRPRFRAPASPAIALEDASSGGAAGSPEARWAVSLQQLPEPDPLEQSSRNDLPSAPTALSTNGAALEGAIASQGDRDWY